VVIADEAHRSQYDFIDGFAKHMRDALPNPSCRASAISPAPTARASPCPRPRRRCSTRLIPTAR
jgi:type I restriction enzyme R subunit